eukprot:scaffold130984_cov33-Tisochrysis_lutea.AAC.2
MSGAAAPVMWAEAARQLALCKAEHTSSTLGEHGRAASEDELLRDGQESLGLAAGHRLGLSWRLQGSGQQGTCEADSASGEFMEEKGGGVGSKLPSRQAQHERARGRRSNRRDEEQRRLHLSVSAEVESQ